MCVLSVCVLSVCVCTLCVGALNVWAFLVCVCDYCVDMLSVCVLSLSGVALLHLHRPAISHSHQALSGPNYLVDGADVGSVIAHPTQWEGTK